MAWFATECHYTSRTLYEETGWVQVVQLTLVADEIADARRSAHDQQRTAARQMRRMTN